MYHVYVLQSLLRNYIYVGLTNSVKRRFDQHQSGKNKTTKPYRPFRLILAEEFQTRVEAREREKFLKSGMGKELLKQMISALKYSPGGETCRQAGRLVDAADSKSAVRKDVLACLPAGRFDSSLGHKIPSTYTGDFPFFYD